VSADAKVGARAAVRSWWMSPRQTSVSVLLRVNDAATPWFEDDLTLVRQCKIAGVLLPKTEEVVQLRRVVDAMPKGGFVLPLIETARGVQNVDAIAAARGVQRLAFGMLDYQAELDLSGDERGFAYPCARMALASKAAGIASPVASVTPEIDDEKRIAEDVAFARAFGFGAKLCIHPKQIAPVRRAFAPSDAEVQWAKRVLAAAEAGPGAVQVDGKMVDRPVILRAQAIVARAAR
jgi:citrate lyase subunit beta/citryl-CoA lyase